MPFNTYNVRSCSSGVVTVSRAWLVNAELVALGILQHYEVSVAVRDRMHLGRAQSDKAVDFGVDDFRRTGPSGLCTRTSRCARFLGTSHRANAVSALHGACRGRCGALYPGTRRVPIGTSPTACMSRTGSPRRCGGSTTAISGGLAGERATRLWDASKTVDDGELWETHQTSSPADRLVRRAPAADRAPRRDAGDSSSSWPRARPRALPSVLPAGSPPTSAPS